MVRLTLQNRRVKESTNTDTKEDDLIGKENVNKNTSGILVIQDPSMSTNGGYYYLRGTIHNNDTRSHEYVKVKVTYYDRNGDSITSDWCYAVDSAGIEPGENQRFEIMTKLFGGETYLVQIVDYQ